MVVAVGLVGVELLLLLVVVMLVTEVVAVELDGVDVVAVEFEGVDVVAVELVVVSDNRDFKHRRFLGRLRRPETNICTIAHART